MTTLANIQSLFEANPSASSVTLKEALSQYSAPLTGFNVAINDASLDVHLILTPVGTLATGTITLPASGTVRDKQTVLVNCTQIITTLTIAANGADAVNGAPAALAANGYFTLKYDLAVNSWYRVG